MGDDGWKKLKSWMKKHMARGGRTGTRIKRGKKNNRKVETMQGE